MLISFNFLSLFLSFIYSFICILTFFCFYMLSTLCSFLLFIRSCFVPFLLCLFLSCFLLYSYSLYLSLSLTLKGFLFFDNTVLFQKHSSFSDLNKSLIAEDCEKELCSQEIISPPKKLRADLPNDRPNDQPIVSPSWYTIV
jgi:hypothetical protein